MEERQRDHKGRLVEVFSNLESKDLLRLTGKTFAQTIEPTYVYLVNLECKQSFIATKIYY